MQYEEWIDGIFNREQLDDFNLDWDEDWIQKLYSLPSSEVLGLIAETFARAGESLRHFSDVQVALGLDFITNECREFLYWIYKNNVSTTERLAVINSIYILYRDCLALQCSDDPAAEATTRMDIYAYMFWDASALSIYGVLHRNIEDKEKLVDAILDVLENTLTISNATCQRAALHGLGHSRWEINHYAKEKHQTDWLQRVEIIIDRYCALSTTDEHLREYALQARTGYVQ